MNTKLSTLPAGIDELKNIDIKSLKVQEIGLNLLLLSLAQKEANRLSKLQSVIEKLEESIFDEELFEHLSPSEQIQRYQLALQSSQNSATYIKGAVKDVNWSDIETKIMILSQESISSDVTQSNSSNDLQNAALMLLQQLSTNKGK